MVKEWVRKVGAAQLRARVVCGFSGPGQSRSSSGLCRGFSGRRLAATRLKQGGRNRRMPPTCMSDAERRPRPPQVSRSPPSSAAVSRARSARRLLAGTPARSIPAVAHARRRARAARSVPTLGPRRGRRHGLAKLVERGYGRRPAERSDCHHAHLGVSVMSRCRIYRERGRTAPGIRFVNKHALALRGDGAMQASQTAPRIAVLSRVILC